VRTCADRVQENALAFALTQPLNEIVDNSGRLESMDRVSNTEHRVPPWIMDSSALEHVLNTERIDRAASGKCFGKKSGDDVGVAAIREKGDCY